MGVSTGYRGTTAVTSTTAVIIMLLLCLGYYPTPDVVITISMSGHSASAFVRMSLIKSKSFTVWNMVSIEYPLSTFKYNITFIVFN